MAKNKAAKPATTKAPPFPQMADSDDQPNVSDRLKQLGLEYLRSRAAETEAKAARVGLFDAVVSKMHTDKCKKFWIITDNGDRKWLGVQPGKEKLKAEAFKTPPAKAKRGRPKKAAAAAAPEAAAADAI